MSAPVVAFPAGRVPLCRKALHAPRDAGDPGRVLLMPLGGRPFDEVALFKRTLAERAFRAAVAALRAFPVRPRPAPAHVLD